VLHNSELQWLGWIKDYDGGTLMECRLSARIPYTAVPAMLRAQREALDARIRTLSRSHIVHPGLSAFAGGKKGPVAVGDIPGGAPPCRNSNNKGQEQIAVAPECCAPFQREALDARGRTPKP